MSDALDPAHLPLIDKALSHPGWLLPIPVALRHHYEAEVERPRHAANRLVLLLMTVLFDLFWLAQTQTAPDILALSALLRLGVFTPCVALFLLLDRARKLCRVYEYVLLTLAVTPVIFTAWLCLATKEMLAQPEIYGTPIILLYTGMLLRMWLPNAIINAILCTLVYSGTIVICSMLPHSQTPTLIFVQLAIAAAVVSFNIQLERRDRWVFLLTHNERIRRALVVAQNSGLLRETQTDGLTELANRRCFDETLSFRWLEALETETRIGLIMIDVDQFKAYNDYYGHSMGDECLRRVALQLAAYARREDLVARYGGEEFAVIMSNVTENEMGNIAERMRAGVAAMALPHDGLYASAVVTISLGCSAMRPEDANGARRLIENADSNLYSAKHDGRNRSYGALSATSVNKTRRA